VKQQHILEASADHLSLLKNLALILKSWHLVKYMWTQKALPFCVFCTIFTLLHPFPTSSPLLLVPTHQTGPILPFCSPILQKKKKTFLFNIATKGVSLWHYIYIIDV
jgi:hypothetical protein